MNTKTSIRKIILQYRRILDPVIFRERNDLINEQLIDLIREKDVKCFHTFLPMERNKEPDVTSLFPELWEKDMKIIVSKTDFQSREMVHYRLKPDTKLQQNKLGIPEPLEAEVSDFNEVELILVPLVAADKLGNRIGYGGGFYDQLLTGTNALKVGLSLSSPFDAVHQKEDWDIPLNILITPFKTYQHG